MNSEIFRILSLIFFLLSAVGVIIGVVIFIKFRMLEVMWELNGTLMKKQIRQIRERTVNENKKLFVQNILEEEWEEQKEVGEGTILLQNCEKNNPNFKVIKNIIYINTEERI